MPEIEVIVTTANPVNVSSKQENINVNFGEVLVRSDMHKIEQFTATQGQTEFLLDEYVKRDSQTVFVNGILQKVGVTYSIEGDTLLFSNGLDEGDEVEIQYVKK